MSLGSFPHLHVASGWSLRHGASTPETLVTVAADTGLSVLGLTDRDGVRGAVRFARATLAAGIAPVLGADLALEEPRPPTRTPARGGASVDPRLPRLTVLAQGEQGWAALCRLVSAAHARAEAGGRRGQPTVDRTLVAQHAVDGGLVVLLGPDSDVGRLLAARRPDQATSRSSRPRYRPACHPSGCGAS